MTSPIGPHFTPFEKAKLRELNMAVNKSCKTVHIDSATAKVIAKFFEESKKNNSDNAQYPQLTSRSIIALVAKDLKNWSLGTKVLSAIKNFFLSLGNNLMLSKEKQPWFVSSPHWVVRNMPLKESDIETICTKITQELDKTLISQNVLEENFNTLEFILEDFDALTKTLTLNKEQLKRLENLIYNTINALKRSGVIGH